MKALRLTAPGHLEVRGLPLPTPGQGEMLLRVRYCALCRTDAKMAREGHRDLHLPRVPGHEVYATDEETGRAFVLWPGRACGRCGPCLSGRENLCPEMSILGFHRDGGFAQWIAVPESSLVETPGDLPGPVASLAEPLACALNAIERSGASAGSRLLVVGAGPVGLLVGLAAHHAGIRTVFAERDRDRWERSSPYRGAMDLRLAPADELRDFDVVIGAAPSAEAFRAGLSATRSGGVFCFFSGISGTATFPTRSLNEIHYREIHVAGAYGCTKRQVETSVRILSARKDEASRLIDRIIGLEEVPEALDGLLAGSSFKVVLDLT